MNKAVEILLGTVASGMAIKLLPTFEANVRPEFLAPILAAVSGSLLYSAMKILATVPMRFPQLRRYIDQQFGIEGYWFEVVDRMPDHPYSFAWIRYNYAKRAFEYKGRNFNDDLSIHARWYSVAMITADANGRIHFLFEADLVKDAESIKGNGVLEFSHYQGKAFHCLAGSYVDSGVSLNKRTFRGDRVSGRYVKQILGRSAIRSDDDVLKVVQRLVADRPILAKSGDVVRTFPRP
jgi:hypothetical protein